MNKKELEAEVQRLIKENERLKKNQETIDNKSERKLTRAEKYRGVSSIMEACIRKKTQQEIELENINIRNKIIGKSK